MKRFLIGGIERTVKNGRLNCGNSDNMLNSDKTGNENGTYVKRIRRGSETFPYASGQWQKKIIKDFAGSQGLNNTKLRLNKKSAMTEGNPFDNYDEDVMGFMNACSESVTVEEYEELSEVDKVGFKKDGKVYKKNVTKKRRAKLQVTALQAVGATKITTEFGVRDMKKEDSVLYTKEVYSSEMSSGFILDITDTGKFKVSDNEKAYRDFTSEEASALGFEGKEEINLEVDEKLKRIEITLDGLHHMNTDVTSSNNLEDLTANFIILADYSIGNAIFNNIFKDGKFDIETLKERILGMEPYRLSKIFIGCVDSLEIGEREEKQNIKQRLEMEFGEDERFELGGVTEIINKYKEQLRENI